MARTFKLLWLIPVAILLNRICTIVPAYYYFDPFPLHDIVNQDGEKIGITLQSYIYFIAIHLAWIILWVREILGKQMHYQVFYSFLGIEILSLLDFLVRYEQPLFDIGNYHVEFTDFKVLMYTLTLITWKLRLSGKSY